MKSILQKLRERKQRLSKNDVVIEPSHPNKYFRFDVCVTRVFKAEGYHTIDTGDETFFGVSEKAHPKEVAQMRGTTKEKQKRIATQVYKKMYWDTMECGKLSMPLDFVVFDCAVNQGTDKAREILEITHDYNEFIFERLKHYRYLDKANREVYGQYYRGWINRLLTVYEECREDAESTI